ncbi:MAG: DNA cytosine methyltransferase [Nitrobacter sp.]
MTAYYNENDKDAAAWLAELIKEGHVAPGVVDQRSIIDVRPADLAGFQQCHFFAGIGGWSPALRTAGWSDDREVWTGSCPCQPFSSAGKQKGFADDRHLWPIWRELIRERRPSIVFGEQVASATAWLGLVRSDLEAMDYAVGAMPIQAASAGADHLRDRFWLVGHDQSERRGERRPEHEVRSWWPAVAGDGGALDMADAGSGRLRGSGEGQGEQPRRTEVVGTGNTGVMADSDDTGSQGRSVLRERADQRSSGQDGVADAKSQRGNGCEDSAGTPGRHVAQGDREHDWVTGADGKARRVKPGVRLLVNGFPSRVGLLRGFGNAIDYRPAAAFIEAACEAIVEQ